MSHRIRVGLGSCGIAAGASGVQDFFRAEIAKRGLSDSVILQPTACAGMCYCEPLVEVIGPDGTRTFYGKVDVAKAGRILDQHVLEGTVVPDAALDLATETSEHRHFLKRQRKIVLRNCGMIDPDSIDAYLAVGGYQALKMALGMSPEAIIDVVSRSGLRGRGGAGFGTAVKWRLACEQPGPGKFIICNADEGDPGAFMDRSTLEGDPHSVLEGMAIAALATGADEGVVYCRAEYPLAVERMKRAIEQAEERGWLGDDIQGTGRKLHLKLKEGAGAFVCGEETALIASIEGKRGMPRRRPPYPAAAGLFGRPTNINNVETYANVPWILLNGAEAYASLGTEKSKGTKVFALAGKVRRGGLVEVPMGITIREIIEEIGGGSNTGRPLKAVQLGGPSGGCIPASLFDTKVDYQEVTRTGAIMGSGGMLVMDESTCMVDVARFFLDFTKKESCGKCTFCRIGTKRLLEILERIVAGRGELSDLPALENLSRQITQGSLCGLGQTAPNPVLTTLRYFREEYLEHIEHKKCRAGVCKALIRFTVTERCTGCGACVRVCPAVAISGQKRSQHEVRQDKCVRCGRCRLRCKFHAIEVN